MPGDAYVWYGVPISTYSALALYIGGRIIIDVKFSGSLVIHRFYGLEENGPWTKLRL